MEMLRQKNLFILIAALGCFLNSCVEPFEAATEDFESALVIEAIITNELKFQEINLSRAFRLENDLPLPESNATIRIVENDQSEYTFRESTPGRYVSTNMFNAQPGVPYQLFVSTADGRSYRSRPSTLTRNTPIGELYAATEINDDDIEGVAILVDTFDPEGMSRFYRFDYEETYKIIAPRWNPQDFLLVYDPPPTFINVVPKTREEEVCYNTVNSVRLILGNTSGFQEDRLSRFSVRFLARDNFFISHRYSILVRQYVISREAHTFYETLNEFSGTESLFSENQPGFLSGNISSETNPNEKVVGFFDVSSVSSRRIFFDHADFYPEDLIPAFPEPCPITIPIRSELLPAIEFNRVKFWARHAPEDATEGNFKVVPRVCGDCTALGSNVVPDFWVE